MSKSHDKKCHELNPGDLLCIGSRPRISFSAVVFCVLVGGLLGFTVRSVLSNPPRVDLPAPIVDLSKVNQAIDAAISKIDSQRQEDIRGFGCGVVHNDIIALQRKLETIEFNLNSVETCVDAIPKHECHCDKCKPEELPPPKAVLPKITPTIPKMKCKPTLIENGCCTKR